MIGRAMGSEHVDAQHHPDKQERNSHDNNVVNPLADGSGLGAVFHGLMVATTLPAQNPQWLDTVQLETGCAAPHMGNWSISRRIADSWFVRHWLSARKSEGIFD
jgi:hypothetical protein